VSQFTETMFFNARCSFKGMTTGEPDAPNRQTWTEVHQQARCDARGLAVPDVRRGDAVAVLAGAPSRSPRSRRAVGCAAVV
jgi:fatty-acyl-CoA synthase